MRNYVQAQSCTKPGHRDQGSDSLSSIVYQETGGRTKMQRACSNLLIPMLQHCNIPFFIYIN
jgi:hypothetical protein